MKDPDIGYIEALDVELMNAQLGTTDSYATPGEAINALIEKTYQKGWREARTNQTLNNGGTVVKDGVEYRAATGRAGTLGRQVDELLAKNGWSVWDEHPSFPVEDWQNQVANGDTILGYWEWVVSEADINNITL